MTSSLPPNLTDLTAKELPANNIKLALFDIDGTLLSLDGQYSMATKKQLSRIQNAGVVTAIASGRPAFAAQFIMDELAIKGSSIFCAGAQLFDPRKNSTIFSHNLDKVIANKFLTCLREIKVHYEIYTQDFYYIESNNIPEVLRIHSQHMRIEPHSRNFEDVIGNESIIKFLVCVTQESEYKLLEELEKQFAELNFAFAKIAAYPEWKFASITSGSANQMDMFRRLTQYYSVTSDQVIAFGDAHSDIANLKSAGVGIAMGNADEDVKSCADYVTKAVWDDGVAYALSRLIR